MPTNEFTRHVIYHGHVQGVGFRATTRQMAQGFRVHGFVRNLPNGTVELLATGETGEVEKLLAAISQRFPAHISQVEEVPEPQAFSETGFTIR